MNLTRHLPPLLAIVLLVCINSCDNSIGDVSPVTLSEMKGIPWFLDKFQTGDSSVGRASFDGFHFVIDSDSTFSGITGCNRFAGSLTMRSRRLEMLTHSVTLLGCIGREFDPDQLSGKWSALMEGSSLRLWSRDSVFSFSSGYVIPVSGLFYTGRPLKVVESNDPMFDALRLFELLPSIELGRRRELELIWFHAPYNTDFSHNKVTGTFAIGENHRILFSYRFNRYSMPKDVAAGGDQGFIRRMLASRKFSVRERGIELHNDASGTSYYLAIDTRPNPR